jgi:hypothetical protein
VFISPRLNFVSKRYSLKARTLKFWNHEKFQLSLNINKVTQGALKINMFVNILQRGDSATSEKIEPFQLKFKTY